MFPTLPRHAWLILLVTIFALATAGVVGWRQVSASPHQPDVSVSAQALANRVPHPPEADRLPLPMAPTPPSPYAVTGSAAFTRSATAGVWASDVWADPDLPIWQRHLDHTALAAAMAARGFDAPQKFRALVLAVRFDPTRSVVLSEHAFDYADHATETKGWVPASTVKLFTAIAALQRMGDLGFDNKVRVTFNEPRPYTTHARRLVYEALVESDNIAHNRLAQLVGFDRLNGAFLSPRHGLGLSGIRYAYDQTRWEAMGEESDLRHAPSITLRRGKRIRQLQASDGTARSRCGASACTSLAELVEAMRRLMLAEQLEATPTPDAHLRSELGIGPPTKSFGLGRDDLYFLRRTLRTPKKRGNGVADAFREVFGEHRIVVYHKPGFASDWASDVLYVFDKRTPRAWVIALAGYPGREALQGASEVLAEVLMHGDLLY